MPTSSLDEVCAVARRVSGPDDVRPACELFSRHFRETVRDRDATQAIRTLHRQALFLAERNRYEDAAELASLALELAEAWRLPRQIARAMNLLGRLAYEQLDWEAARGWYESALEVASFERDDELIAGIYLNLGIVENILGHYHEARARYLESIASAVRCGERGCLLMTYNNLGMVCTDLGEWMESLVCFDRGIEIAEELGEQRFLAVLHVNRAEPLLEIGDSERTNQSLTAAEQLARELDLDAVLTDVERFRARQARRRGDQDVALSHVERALSIASASDLQLHWAEAIEERGWIFLESSQPQRAAEDFKLARDVYAALAARGDLARTERCIEACHGPSEP